VTSSQPSDRYASIRPGQVWLDTNGQRIQAHGGSVLEADGVYYWYGENKEHTTADSDIWTWGIRCYRSTDLYNWEDCGLIIAPTPDDPTSPLHPTRAKVDRPHIIRKHNGTYVCWIKVMLPDDAGQESTILTAPDILGPWTIVRTGLRPLGMSAGDFDLVIDPHDGKAYYYFERVHSELICADLTDDATDVTGYYSTHFVFGVPPYVREAPAHFSRHGLHYMFTSGTSGYVPNPSHVACATTYHGPWQSLGDPHPDDESRTSYCSQISSVFKVPGKKDLYIACADRWMPNLPSLIGARFTTGEFSRGVTDGIARRTDPDGWYGAHDLAAATMDWSSEVVSLFLDPTNTSIADYVWLPVRFDGTMAYLDWRDEWRIEDYD
jgi:hypothetical protein